MAFPFLPINSIRGVIFSASAASRYTPSPAPPMASMRSMANMRFSAAGMRLPTPQAASAVRPEARKIFAISGTMRFMPSRRSRRRKR